MSSQLFEKYQASHINNHNPNDMTRSEKKASKEPGEVIRKETQKNNHFIKIPLGE